MPNFHPAEVLEVLESHEGIQRLRLRFDIDRPGDRAYALTALVGEVAVGDRVVCNTTAVDLGLGTGGWHVVHWNLSHPSLEVAGPGHVMKLRYTGLQFSAGTAELVEPMAERLDGLVVVVCQVHSQVPVVAASLAAAAPRRRVAYVMTDGASLPIALSDTVRGLRERGLVDHTVTAGHAFGGDLEAVTVASGLALARARGAEVAVVGMGPGVVGTGTPLGTTAIDSAAHLDVAAALGATPVLCVRASDGDRRERHRGISHHTRTVARLTSSSPFVAPVPADAAALAGVRVLRPPGLARWEEPTADAAVALLDAAGLRVTTMGRSPERDPMFFRASAAAGEVAAALAGGAAR